MREAAVPERVLRPAVRRQGRGAHRRGGRRPRRRQHAASCSRPSISSCPRSRSRTRSSARSSGSSRCRTSAAASTPPAPCCASPGRGTPPPSTAPNPRTIMDYGAAVRVLRVVVNVGNSLGSSGIETNLAPTMTIGTGYFGRSSVAENLQPKHLAQWTQVAYNADAATSPSGTSPASPPGSARTATCRPTRYASNLVADEAGARDLRRRSGARRVRPGRARADHAGGSTGCARRSAGWSSKSSAGS